MTGDFTRTTFRPARHFSTVRMQQGRVLLDADWNEQSDIARWFERITNGDVIGRCGFPEDVPGFGLLPVPNDLAITAGRGYVAGRLVESPGSAPVGLARISGSGAATLYRVTDGMRLRVGQLLAPVDDDLANSVIVSEVTTDEQGAQQVRLSGGLGAGTVKRRTAWASVGVQPHLIGEPLPTDAGDYLAYLEVWERPIGALEDPYLREVALGKPDTCQREQMIWQVKLWPLAGLIADGIIPAPPSCKSFGPGWRPEGDVAAATLAARAEAASAEDDPCALPAAGGYRSLENHLYRVEIHNGGTVDTDKVAWKWSRDNVTHRARLLEVKDRALVVDSPGLDDATAFRSNQWLEVLDEARILAGKPGFFVQLGEVNGNRLAIAKLLDPDLLTELVDNGNPDTAKLPSAGQVRRWEGGAPVEVAPGEWLKLENGVEVFFDAGFLRTGDYWRIPARTVTADVEWPRDPSSGAPAPRPPEGIARHYCTLAIVAHDGSGSWSVTEDCRPLFPPLARLETFHYLGGDGQEAMPDLSAPADRVALDAPLRVGVARGATPVVGRLVRFAVEEASNAAALSPPAGTDVVSSTDAELIVRSGADGVAAAELTLHPQRHTHHVTAELLDSGVPAQANREHLPIRFTANLSTADEVAYDPAQCAFQSDERLTGEQSRTVQEALDKLCALPVMRPLGGDGQLLCQEQEAPEPLRVGLFWGKFPLTNVSVGFEVVSGDATVDAVAVQIGAEGTAEVRLKGGSDPLKDGGAVRIVAKTLDLPLPAQPQALTFHARFSNASCVYVDRNVCPEVVSRERSVASILRHLCERGGGGEGLHVKEIHLEGSGRPLIARANVTPEDLAGGVIAFLDGAPSQGAFKGGEIGKVVADLPAPAPGSPTERFYQINPDLSLPFTAEYELVGAFSGEPNTEIIRWQPDRSARRWLEVEATRLLSQLREVFRINHLEARFIIHGNRIWGEENPDLYLDGDLFLDPREQLGARYPSGDGLRGGDLVLPFRLSLAVIG